MIAALETRSDLAKSSILSFTGSAISAAMGLLLVILLGRVLGGAGSGVVLQVIGTFTIALGVSRFGLDSAALWILPGLWETDRGRLRPTIWFLLLSSGVVGAVCALVLSLSTLLAESRGVHDPTVDALRSILWALPFASVLLTALSASRALGKVTSFVLVGSIGLPTARPLAVLIAVGLGGGSAAAAFAWALPLLPAVLTALIVLIAQSHRAALQRQPGYFRSGVPIRALRYALPRVLSSSLEQLLIWLAVILVGILAGPAAAGVYGTASRFVAAGMIVDTAIRVVVSPMFSRLQHVGRTAALEELYRTATVWLMLFSAPVYMLLAVFSPLALSLVGDAFTAGESAMVIMCAGMIITLLAGNIHSVLLMSGRSGLAAANKAVAVGVNVGLLYLLVPLVGIIGAAIAWAVACALDAALATVEVRRILQVRVSLIPGLLPLLLALLAVGIPAILARCVLGTTWLALMTAAVIGGGLFVLCCVRGRSRLHLDGLISRARS